MTYSNNSAYKQTIDTLTFIDSKIIEQKFYEIKNIPDFVDIETGRGGVSETIMNYSTFDTVGGFETGNFGSGVDFEKTASADIVIDTKTFYRQAWKKSVTYNLFDVSQANQAKVINIIEGKLKARKKNWDLGIQETIFLGSKENENITGLLNNDSVNVDTTSITKSLSSMSAEEFNNFIATIPNKFYLNANRTCMFNRMIIPASDYNGLASQMSATFPMKTKLEVLEEAFKATVAGYGETDFKILPLGYADASMNGKNKNIYVLYRKDIDTLIYDLALDYTTTAFNTLNSFDFCNIAYGMYGSVNILRPQEVLYFQY